MKKYRGEEDIPQLDPREVRNTWCFDKDGKHMLIDGEDSIYMRK